MRKTAKIFKALSDPTRLRILMLLRQKELCVCELVFILDMEQSRISHQLRILREAELVEDIREGKWIIYRIPGETTPLLEGVFEPFVTQGLEQTLEVKTDRKNLKICLEKDIRKHRGI